MQTNGTKKHNSITNFFRLTFRRHTGSEYSELLTRGLHGEKGVNEKYPWAYLRMFALFFVLFAVFLLIVRFTSNELFAPTITVLASACFNLPFLMFLYELYPERDISFLAVFLAMLLGGAAADVISQILFSLVRISNPWLKAVCTGFFEELPKAAAAIVVIIISRKRSPLSGFLFGAAVGCGFSIVEDMGYIFVQANEMPMMNLTTIIEIAVSRGASALCTHTLWTAAIGWAYCHFQGHLANIFFYPVTLLSCALHVCWDLPLNYVALGFVYAVCVLIACSECAAIVHTGRKKVFGAKSKEEAAGNADEDTLVVTDPEYWNHWGHVALVIGAFLMAVIAVIYCSIPFRETYGTETFTTPESFVAFMQEGKKLAAEEDRVYDAHNTENDYRPPAQPDVIAQWVEAPEARYGYFYNVQVDTVSGNEYYFLTDVWAVVEESGGENTYKLEKLYNNGVLYASFFRLTDNEVTGYNFESNGNITVFIYDADFERNLLSPRYAWLFVTFGAIFGACTICYISLKIKSWRVKKCSTKNVSSVE